MAEKKCAKEGCKKDTEKDSNYCAEHKPDLRMGPIDEARVLWPKDKK